MPGATGVVLADEEGHAVASDVRPGVDAALLARHARGAQGAGTLVPFEGALYFVVTLPSQLAATLAARSAAPASALAPGVAA